MATRLLWFSTESPQLESSEMMISVRSKKKIEGQILQLEKMKELDDAAKKTHQPPNLKTTLLLFVPRL